jgi:four helix bundle protein
MASAKRFEDLEVWQVSFDLVQQIYRVSGTNRFDRDLCSQIRRASISVVSNIAEGFERESNKEFAHVLSIVKGSIGEVRSQL